MIRLRCRCRFLVPCVKILRSPAGPKCLLQWITQSVSQGEHSVGGIVRKMTEIQFIVEKLNEPPFNKDLRLVRPRHCPLTVVVEHSCV